MMDSDARRYASKVELSSKNTSQAQLVLLTGLNKKVLEVGPASGDVAEALRKRGCQITAVEKDPAAAEVAAQFCERMVVGDIEKIDLASTFAGDQFDVIMFGDVLEHLVDPKAVLQKIRHLLRDGGCVVASIPNIAHAAVRLMLLDGTFAYTQEGLLDRTHLRFFTVDSVQDLFREAGYAIRVWRRITVDTFATEHQLSQADYPPHLVSSLSNDPEAFTYQFVVKAYPSASRRPRRTLPASTARSDGVLKALRQVHQDEIAGKEALQAERDALRKELGALRAEKESHIANIEAALHNATLQASAAVQRIDEVTNSVGYRLLEWVRRPIRWLAPEGTRRRLAFVAASRAANILLTRGPWSLLRRAAQVWQWLPRLRHEEIAREELTFDDQYQLWLEAHALTPALTRSIKKRASRLRYRPKVSVIMPVYNTDPAWLREALDSVRGQLYDNWELCIADDGSTLRSVRVLLEEFVAADSRIKVAHLEKNQGIAAASNKALTLASGEFVAFLDHDDELKPDALYEVVKLLNENPDLDFVYTDEDHRSPEGKLVQPFFKPDWSPDLLLSINYVPHFAVYRKQLVDQVGGLRNGYELSQDYDLTLRVTERTTRIAHVALPLYTWRLATNSASAHPRAKLRAVEAAKRALADAMQRRNIEADILDASVVTTYRVRYRIQGQPRVTIIIPTRDRVDLLRRCIASIEGKSTYTNYEIVIVDNESREEATREYLKGSPHRCLAYPGKFRYAAMMNFAARETAGDYILFLNNDTEVIAPEWIEAMLEHCQRPQVGVVGARLLYPDGRVQHEGIIIGLAGGCAANVDHGEYFGLGKLVRNCTAVTAACMMTSYDVFERLGGFDENLEIAYNDVDYCLRALEHGYVNVYTPYALIYHHEGGTRGWGIPEQNLMFFRQRWGKPGEYRDPYYNSNLDLLRPFHIRL